MSRTSGRLAALALTVAACAGATVTSLPSSTTSTSTTTTSTTSTSTTTSTTIPLIAAEGVVVDMDGRPLSGVQVRFGEVAGVTDPSGGFWVEAREPGNLLLTKPGRLDREVAWPLTDDEPIAMESMTVRALRVGGPAAGNEDQFRRILEIANSTVVNSLLFDTKQEGGQVMYVTEVTTAREIGAVDARYDPSEVLVQAKSAGLYTITRIVAFEDRFWANANREDRLAGSWVDPAAPAARRYNLDLAVEACRIGFDEIQFDYVRYPTGIAGRQSGHRSLPEEQRVATVAGFLEEARTELAPLGCALSADIFGIVVSTQNDQSIGQRPEDLSRHLDAISPMIYPSHYSDGWLGLADPNDHPYRVVANAIDSATPRIEAGVLRPWLQAFWWSDAQILESITAAEERGVGWLLWNSGSSFNPGSIPKELD